LVENDPYYDLILKFLLKELRERKNIFEFQEVNCQNKDEIFIYKRFKNFME
jgi:hypothetical protein